ncbi:MAG: CHAT domain-containing protein, partial [Cytophagaceae bacterium]|nr:CHAT domain-containing protein [Cytophagaceae bacterium]
MKYFFLFTAFTIVFYPVQAQVSPALVQKAQQALMDADYPTASSLATQGMNGSFSKVAPEYRALVDVLIESKIASDQLQEASTVTKNYIAVLSNAYGKEDTSLVSYIAALGSISQMNGYYEEALTSYEQSADILQKKSLTHTRDYAELENNIGMLYSQTRELAKSVRALELSRTFFEKDQEHYKAELAIIYNNLGDVYHNKYDYAKANQYYNLSLTFFEKLKDGSSPDYLNTLGNYSLLLLDRGLEKEAILNLLKDKSIAEKTVGKESPEYAAAINNLGQAYKQVGNYSLAQDYLIEAYDIKRKIYDKDHPSRMTAGNNLAMFYYSIGQLDRAEIMLDELAGLQKTSHPDDLQQELLYANNLSAIYFAQGKISKAQQKAQLVVKALEKSQGANSIEYFQAMNGYSALLLEDDSKLETAYQNYMQLSKLYATLKTTLPIEDAITYLNNKGSAAMYTNRHTEAAADFQTGMKLAEEQYGKQHDYYYLFKSNLAYDYNLQGKYQEAAVPLLESAQFRLAKVTEVFPTLTEFEKEFYLQKSQADLTYYYTFCIKNYTQYPTLTGEMANLRLQSKSLVMRSLSETKKKILNSNNIALIDQYHRVMDAKKELAKYRGLSKRDLHKLSVVLETAFQKTEQLEKELYKNSAYLNVKSETPTWKSIANGLKPTEAAIEVIRVADNNYAQSRILYYAFIIIKNGQTQPELIVLKNGRELEKKQYNSYRNNIQYKLEDKSSFAAYWSEVAKKLSGVTKVYFSADGIYNKINLQTLYNTETKKYLLDELDIENKASLGNPIGALNKTSNEAFLIGHPNYYLDLKEALNNYSRGKEPVARTVSSDVVTINDLPGTKEEVLKIEEILKKSQWKVSKFTEEQAIENKVKNLNHPRIVHLATHGFFEESSNDSLSQYSENYFIDPLLRSGLIFSGAGVPLSPHELEDTKFFDDGILYANEALSLNLTGTECVVLSACETGLGEIRNQE